MRKLSIVLLVGLMLIGGMSLGVLAQEASESADHDGGDLSEASVNRPEVTIGINKLAAIYVDHESVTLETLSSVSIDEENGELDDLSTLNPTAENTDFNVYAYANVEYDVQIDVVEDSSDTSDLNGNLGVDVDADEDSWKDVISEGSSQTVNVVTEKSATEFLSRSVNYRYEPDKNDTPGEYSVQLQYTISTS